MMSARRCPSIAMSSVWRSSSVPRQRSPFSRPVLSTPQGAGTVGHNSILYFKVSDIVATHAAILSRGAKNERSPQLTAKMPDHELWAAFVRDPDGNLIGLMEEKR